MKGFCKNGHDLSVSQYVNGNTGKRRCGICQNEYRRNRYHGTHGEKIRIRNLAYHNNHSADIYRRRRERRKQHPEKYLNQLRRNRARRNGISVAQLDQMEKDQRGRCAACHRKATLVVDHCHVSGIARHLLCNQCNTAVGLLQDSPERIRKLLNYVVRVSQIVIATQS